MVAARTLEPYPSVAEDTTQVFDHYDSLFLGQTRKLQGTNKAVENDSVLNLYQYILEKRYRGYGDKFSRRWLDHLYLQAGAGIESMIAPNERDRFDPLAMVHVAIGKDFTRLHSVRVKLNAGVGYQSRTDHQFLRIGGDIDYLYNLSSYMSGYRPDAMVSASIFLGGGFTYNKLQGGLGYESRSATAINGHIGAQLRFFAGPQAYLNIEPYIGVGSDGMDLSDNRNWRRYDVLYGVNMNFVYYLRNNLSPEARARYWDEATRKKWGFKEEEDLSNSWRAPFFIDAGIGGSLWSGGGDISLGKTLGHTKTVGFGKWLSPAIGVRISGTISQNPWHRRGIPGDAEIGQPNYVRTMYAQATMAQAEAVINPLGFTRNYNWDAKWGVNILLGGGLGWTVKYDETLVDNHLTFEDGAYPQTLSLRSENLTAALRFWVRLGNDLQAFIEPRYTHLMYNLPYTNIDRHQRYGEDLFQLTLGFATQWRKRVLREDRHVVDSLHPALSEHRFFAGLGIGVGTYHTTGCNEGGVAPVNLNGLAYVGYRFNRMHAVRLHAEFIRLSHAQFNNFVNYNLDYPEYGYLPLEEWGQYTGNFNILTPSLNYYLNLTELFTGTGNPNRRRWNLNVFAGPSLGIYLGNGLSRASIEYVQKNHAYVVDKEDKTTIGFGANFGANLSYAFTRNLYLFIEPKVYLFGKLGIPSDDIYRGRIYPMTLNAGVQYCF